jgi:hypothetical protein
VTPAHDPVDYEIGLRHKLETPNVIIGLDARITGAEIGVGRTPGSTVMKHANASSPICALGLLVEAVPHRHSVSTSLAQRRRRAPALAAVVLKNRAAGRSGPSPPIARVACDSCKSDGAAPTILAREYPRLERLATNLVGTSAAGLVHAGRP